MFLRPEGVKRTKKPRVSYAFSAMSQQLKSLLPYIARYKKQIAELFHAHPHSFLFRDFLGLWH
jgi:hypothetical protein